MSGDRDDERLRRIFADLRRSAPDVAPPFDHVWAAAMARARHRPPRARWAVAAACAVAATIVAAILLNRGPSHDFDAASRLAAWRSPTASLLKVPGDDILRSVPSVGASFVRLETLQPTATTP